jgi:hypothetical protein
LSNYLTARATCDIFLSRRENFNDIDCFVYSPASHQPLGLVPLGVSLDLNDSRDLKRNPDHAFAGLGFYFSATESTEIFPGVLWGK